MASALTVVLVVLVCVTIALIRKQGPCKAFLVDDSSIQVNAELEPMIESTTGGTSLHDMLEYSYSGSGSGEYYNLLRYTSTVEPDLIGNVSVFSSNSARNKNDSDLTMAISQMRTQLSYKV